MNKDWQNFLVTPEPFAIQYNKLTGSVFFNGQFNHKCPIGLTTEQLQLHICSWLNLPSHRVAPSRNVEYQYGIPYDPY